MENIRPYQIFIVITVAVFLLRTLRRYIVIRVNLIETILSFSFWTFILLLALFPDKIGGGLSKLFGFESDTNAVIFFLLGILMFVIFRLYNRIRIQDKNITALTRRIALLEHEQEQNEDSIHS